MSVVLRKSHNATRSPSPDSSDQSAHPTLSMTPSILLPQSQLNPETSSEQILGCLDKFSLLSVHSFSSNPCISQSEQPKSTQIGLRCTRSRRRHSNVLAGSFSRAGRNSTRKDDPKHRWRLSTSYRFLELR